MEIALISGVVSILVAFLAQFVIRKNFNESLKEDYRRRYFEKQFETYLKFWKLLRPLSKYYSDRTLIKIIDKQTYLNKEVTITFMESFTDFFFSEHGLFLTREIRKVTFGFIDDLADYIRREEAQTNYVPITSEEKSKIMNWSQNIFTTARGDIGALNVKFDVKRLRVGKIEE